MAGRQLAASLDGRNAIFIRGIDFVVAAAIHKLVWHISAYNAGVMGKIMAVRIESGGLHRGILLGIKINRRFTRRIVSWRVAGLGVVMGRTPATELVERATLQRGVAGSDGRIGFILAGIESGQTNPFAWRIVRFGFQHFVGELQPSRTPVDRASAEHGNCRAFDVDVRRLDDAVGLAGSGGARHQSGCQAFERAIPLHSIRQRCAVCALEQRASSLARQPGFIVQ